MKVTVNFEVPEGWTALDDKQLRFVYRLIANDVPIGDARVLCLMKWSGCRLLHKYGNGNYICAIGKNRFEVSPGRIAELSQSLDWLSDFSRYPVHH